MKSENRIKALINLLKDILKEPGPAVVGFICSTAIVHMFCLAFHQEIDPGLAIKHNQILSKKGRERLKRLVRGFPKKETLFSLWEGIEEQRTRLCYGHPSQEDITLYLNKFYQIKKILEEISQMQFEIEDLENILEEQKEDG